MEIWEPKPPGTLWATPGLLRDCFTSNFTFTFYMQLRYQPDALATLPNDKKRYLLNRRLDGASRNGPTFGAGNKLLLLLRCEPRIIQTVA